MFLVPSVFSCYKKLSIEFLNGEINIRVSLSSFSLLLLPICMCFYSLSNSMQNGVFFLFFFLNAFTFVSGGSLFTSIWLVVTWCTLFFLEQTEYNYQEVLWNWSTSGSLYIYSGYGSSSFLSFLIRQNFTEKNKSKFDIGVFKHFVSEKGGEWSKIR